MPIIHIEIARGKTPEQLQALMSNVHRAAVDALSVPEASVRILLQEIEPALWFSGGRSLADR